MFPKGAQARNITSSQLLGYVQKFKAQYGGKHEA